MDKEIILKFLSLYSTKVNILGIIFYGSSNYGSSDNSSDIDLLFITDGDKNYKGTTYIDGKKIEYFEKNIYYLMDKIDTLDNDYDRSLISIFKNGNIIYSKDDTINYLKEEVLAKSMSFPKKKKKKNSILLNEFLECINVLTVDSNWFNYVYYNLLEFLRKRYHEENGYSKLPSMKVFKLYSNPSYAKKFYCVNLPNKEFIDLYLDLLNGYNKEKLNLLCDLIKNKTSCSNIKNYTNTELKYLSTIVNNMVDKVSYYLKENINHSDICYYIALERIRRLYCYINYIDDNFNFISEDYDIKFIELFNLCLSEKSALNLRQLFDYVVQTIKIDYKNYKILELS